MASAAFRRDEKIGLGAAIVLHVALVAVLLFQPEHDDVAPPIPERMTVNLAEEVGLEATAPDPVRESRAAIAPTLAPEPEPMVEPVPEPVAEPVPTPPQRTVARPAPQPRPTAAPRREQPRPRETSRPAPRPSAAPTRSGGSRIGSDFLAGSGESTSTTETRTVAAAFGPTEQAALESAINRQLKRHWRAPQGVDSERLVTVLSWELNRDGSLAGQPRVVSQSGINDTNRPQADIHAENAIRAVQLAAPFDLPDQYYDQWRRIRSWRFDRRL